MIYSSFLEHLPKETEALEKEEKEVKYPLGKERVDMTKVVCWPVRPVISS